MFDNKQLIAMRNVFVLGFFSLNLYIAGEFHENIIDFKFLKRNILNLYSCSMDLTSINLTKI